MAEVGNPHSLHASGRAARRRLEEARESLASDLGARPSEIVFTSGGTEANNLALLGIPVTQGRRVLAISAVEHASVAAVRGRREPVRILPVTPSGHLDLTAATDLVRPDVAVAAVMWVNNETGAIQPISKIRESTYSMGALLHTDAVAAFGHVPIDMNASGADLLSVSAHKVGGPVGIGALVVRQGVRLDPPGFGGEQEGRLRSGTVPVALAVGFAAAARLAVAELATEAARLVRLRDRLIAAAQLMQGCSVNTCPPASPAIVNLTFDGVRADDLLLLLDAAGIDASTGSACTAGVHQPSDVLLAMGRSQEQASASLRFSFGHSSVDADLDRLLAALPPALESARAAMARAAQ